MLEKEKIENKLEGNYEEDDNPDSLLVRTGKVYDVLQRLGPRSGISGETRDSKELEGIIKLPFAFIMGTAAGLAEGIFGSVALPTSARIGAEEILDEYRESKNPKSAMLKTYDSIYNGNRAVSRTLVGLATLYSMVDNPENTAILWAGALASGAYELARGYKKLRNRNENSREDIKSELQD